MHTFLTPFDAISSSWPQSISGSSLQFHIQKKAGDDSGGGFLYASGENSDAHFPTATAAAKAHIPESTVVFMFALLQIGAQNGQLVKQLLG